MCRCRMGGVKPFWGGGLRAERSGFTPPAPRGLCFSVLLEVDGEQGNIYSPAGSDILQSSGKASMQLGIPKCLVCHLLSLLKPSLKGSLEDCEKR